MVKKEVEMEEQCGKPATNLIKYGDGIKMYLCTGHFSSRDIQRMVTRKLVEREYLNESTERCQAEVKRKELDLK